ncbi:methylated-DNA-[protein]-cysteine S-methyltransferase [Antricoccus suffuscus]|uniref:Methylated-DNA--protein-cysteine methyltransferase n=1 Tax=Antricoccus suffuscus TaxID=1629062 RepID=A0A2T1A0T3_9ACTN|nr:methylated-DNA--[protein]-cysteine S-methyltransferase [Antricoccus suffuscus]PRZ42216.1 methylated-DNA-[protein]-cysteine S-methyltransferase [Antricoccus suffuscus]
MTSHKTIDSPVGDLTLVLTGDGVLCGLYMRNQRHLPSADRFGESSTVGFDQVESQLAEYFAGVRTQFDLDLDPAGTDFQRKVWLLLREIPYGETISYAQLSDRYGDPLAIRAVASANGKNPIGIIVPCHRVIGSDGSLTGYAGGLERKRFLLDLENPIPAEATLF